MSFDPHSQTLVTNRGVPVKLKTVLPDGTFLFDAVGKLIITNRQGKNPASGRLAVWDATQPKPKRNVDPSRQKLPPLDVGQRVIFATLHSKNPKIMVGTVKSFNKNVAILRLIDGTDVKAVPHLNIFSTREEMMAVVRNIQEHASQVVF